MKHFICFPRSWQKIDRVSVIYGLRFCLTYLLPKSAQVGYGIVYGNSLSEFDVSPDCRHTQLSVALGILIPSDSTAVRAVNQVQGEPLSDFSVWEVA